MVPMTDDLMLAAPDEKTQATAVVDFCAKSFGGYWGFTEYSRNGYILRSHYDWDASQIGMIRDKIVTHFGIWEYLCRIGGDTVKSGGIGVVCTDMRHRKRGYMADTTRASVASMKRHGYHLSVLFGLSDFYDKFGYVDGWDSSEIRFKHSDLPNPNGKIKLKKYIYKKGSEIDALYNRSNKGLTGTAVRPTYGVNRRPSDWECWKWTDDNGKVAGYIVCALRNGRFSVVDWGGKADSVFAAISTLLRKTQCSEVRINDVHEKSPLYRDLYSFNYRQETFHTRNGGCMIRVINPSAFVGTIKKTLQKRLKSSAIADWTGTVKIQSPEETFFITLRGKKIDVSARPDSGTDTKHTIKTGFELAQLLVGVEEPEEIMRRSGMRATGDAKAVVSAIFPHQHPSLGNWDHF